MKHAAFKVLVDDNNHVLGAHIISDNAAGLINIFKQAMLQRQTVEELYWQHVMTPYPSRESDIIYMLKPFFEDDSVGRLVNALPVSSIPEKGALSLTRIRRFTLATFFLLVLLQPSGLPAADPAAKPAEAPTIGIAESMGDAMLKQASEVREDITQQARSLFERQAVGVGPGHAEAPSTDGRSICRSTSPTSSNW